jgi:hypothetical protein
VFEKKNTIFCENVKFLLKRKFFGNPEKGQVFGKRKNLWEEEFFVGKESLFCKRENFREKDNFYKKAKFSMMVFLLEIFWKGTIFVKNVARLFYKHDKLDKSLKHLN